MSDSEIVMLIGLPASGKSTWRERYQNDAVVISSDDMVEAYAVEHELNYSQAFRAVDMKQLEKAMFEQYQQAIAEGRYIIIDRTNLNPKTRNRFLKDVPVNYRKVGVVFEVSDDELQQRLDKRAVETGKTIPAFVIDSMRTSYIAPTLEEFHEIRKA